MGAKGEGPHPIGVYSELRCGGGRYWFFEWIFFVAEKFKKITKKNNLGLEGEKIISWALNNNNVVQIARLK